MTFEQDLQRLMAKNAARQAQPVGALPSIPGVTDISVRNPAPSNVMSFKNVELPGPKQGGIKGALSDAAGSTVGKGFLKLIDYVDTPRAAVVSTLKELGDVTGFAGGDGSWDWDQWAKNTKDNYGAGDLAEQVMGPDGTDRPMWMRQAVGLIGDVGLDPLTWMSGGTIAAVKGASKAGGKLAAKEIGEASIDLALKNAGRTEIAGAIARTSAAKSIAGELTEQELKAAARLTEKAGTHGRAAFTKKNRAAAGADDALLQKLGVNTKLGYSVGTRNHRLNIPFSRTLAEAIETGKGGVKSSVAKTATARKWRARFAPDDEAFNEIYKRAQTQVLEGAPNAARAALTLSHITQAKSMAHMWGQEQIKFLQGEFDWLRKGKSKVLLREGEAQRLVDLVESGAHLLDQAPGDVSAELFDHAKRVNKWFEDQAEFLRSKGVDVPTRANYMPHMRSQAWIDYEKAKGSMDDASKWIIGDRDAGFTMPRQLEEGMPWFGQVLGPDDLTIRRLNEISLEEVGFKALEDNPEALMGQWISNARPQLLKDNIRQLGESQDVLKSIKGKLVESKQAAQEAKSLKAATDARRGAIDAVITHTKKGIVEARKVVKQVDAELTRVRNKINGHETKLAAAQAQHKSLLEARAQLDGLKPTVASAKKSLTARINALDAQLAKSQENVDFLAERLRLARNGKKIEEWTAKKQAADAAHDALQKDLEAATLNRQGLDEFLPETTGVPGTTPVPKDARGKKVSDVKYADKGLLAADEQIAKEVSAIDAAAAGSKWLDYDKTTKSVLLNDAAEKAVAAEELFDTAKLVQRSQRAVKPTKGEAVALKHQRNDMLIGQIEAVRDLSVRAGDDEATKIILDMEKQALVFDAKTAHLVLTAQEVRDGLQVAINDPKFAGRLMTDIEDGFARIAGTDLQGPTWYAEAMKKVPDLRNASEAKQLADMLKKYDAAMNVWKSWATGSPGFVVRNVYSGMFNMYLDGVDPLNVKKMQGFLKRYEGWNNNWLSNTVTHEQGMEVAKKWARSKGYTDRDIAYFEQAIEAATGSGWGLTPHEVSEALERGVDVGLGSKFNPLSTEFAPTGWVRNKSGNAEARMRAGHAFDHLVKGGDITSAVETLEKFHFNYRDISQLDRAMKRVMPFWMFYSRNMSLQASVWGRMPDKLNRSYYNFKRNMEAGHENDDVKPRYFGDIGAVGTQFGSPGGSQWYATPDLPSLRFINDIDNLGDPSQIASSFAPAFKVPVEQLMGKKLFTGAPFKDRLHDYTADGQPYNRKAPRVFQIPGVKQILAGATEFIPGVKDQIQLGPDGELLMTDRIQSAIEDFAPLVGRASKLVPNNPKDNSRVLDRWLSFAGIPVKQNTDAMIQGENYRRSLDIQNAAQRIRQQQLLGF